MWHVLCEKSCFPSHICMGMGVNRIHFPWWLHSDYGLQFCASMESICCILCDDDHISFTVGWPCRFLSLFGLVSLSTIMMMTWVRIRNEMSYELWLLIHTGFYSFWYAHTLMHREIMLWVSLGSFSSFELEQEKCLIIKEWMSYIHSWNWDLFISIFYVFNLQSITIKIWRGEFFFLGLTQCILFIV